MIIWFHYYHAQFDLNNLDATQTCAFVHKEQINSHIILRCLFAVCQQVFESQNEFNY